MVDFRIGEKICDEGNIKERERERERSLGWVEEEKIVL